MEGAREKTGYHGEELVRVEGEEEILTFLGHSEFHGKERERLDRRLKFGEVRVGISLISTC